MHDPKRQGGNHARGLSIKRLASLGCRPSAQLLLFRRGRGHLHRDRRLEPLPGGAQDGRHRRQPQRHRRPAVPRGEGRARGRQRPRHYDPPQGARRRRADGRRDHGQAERPRRRPHARPLGRARAPRHLLGRDHGPLLEPARRRQLCARARSSDFARPARP